MASTLAEKPPDGWMGDKTVQRSSSVAKRLGTVGLAAFVVGAVLLGTGIAASAKTTAKAASAGPLKKKPTTTTTTLAPTTTTATTQPCNAQAGTGSASGKGQGTLVATPPGASGTPGAAATCVSNGTQLTLSATGLTPASDSNSLGTFIECNDDPGQPTFSIIGNAIPVSCSGALAYVFTPNAAGTAQMPDPSNLPTPLPAFTVVGGTTGPPCVPTLCTTPKGAVIPDSAGNSPYVDAALYPCPPTPAEVAKGDTCVVAVGDTGGDQVTVPLSFNPNIPPTPATVGTAPPTSPNSGTTAPAAKNASTKAGSSALAFTGSGPDLWWLALAGLLLMLFGGLLLTVVDQPRRLLQLALRSRRSRHDT
jgi:hypothetical protein